MIQLNPAPEKISLYIGQWTEQGVISRINYLSHFLNEEIKVLMKQTIVCRNGQYCVAVRVIILLKIGNTLFLAFSQNLDNHVISLQKDKYFPGLKISVRKFLLQKENIMQTIIDSSFKRSFQPQTDIRLQ